MRFYHRTHDAKRILDHGFEDGEGTYGSDEVHRGVWVADRVPGPDEGDGGRFVLAIDAPEAEILPYEWADKDSGCREFLVPAETLNRFSIGDVAEDPLPERER